MFENQEINISEIDDIVVFENSKMVNMPSSAIHIENDISLLQKKLWFELVYRAFPNMGKRMTHKIALEDLRKLLGYSESTDNYKELKEALLGLNKTVISWNIFNKDKKNLWECFPLLAGCRIPKDSGVCLFEFSSFLEERFLAMGEEAYVKIDLIISKKFQSKYSLSMYCLALDYLMLKMGYSEKKFSIEELRRYLALKEGEYQLTGDFNKRIIKPSEEEINEISDLNIEILPFKEGRKIMGYKLCMSLKEGRIEEYFEKGKKLRELRDPNGLNLYENKNQNQYKESPIKRDFIQIKNETLKSFFSKYNISSTTDTFQEKLRDTREMFGTEKMDDYLIFLMKYAENEYKKGLVKNFSGFFVSLFKDDTQISNYFYELEQIFKREEAKKIRVEALIELKIKENYEIAMTNDFETYLLENIDFLENKFIELVKANVTKGFGYDYLIMNQNKGVIDKTLLLNYRSHIRAIIINEIKGFQSELNYQKPTFEIWKAKTINEEYLNNLRFEIQASI